MHGNSAEADREHYLVMRRELERDWVLVNEVSIIIWAGECLKNGWRNMEE